MTIHLKTNGPTLGSGVRPGSVDVSYLRGTLDDRRVVNLGSRPRVRRGTSLSACRWTVLDRVNGQCLPESPGTCHVGKNGKEETLLVVSQVPSTTSPPDTFSHSVYLFERKIKYSIYIFLDSVFDTKSI